MGFPVSSVSFGDFSGPSAHRAGSCFKKSLSILANKSYLLQPRGSNEGLVSACHVFHNGSRALHPRMSRSGGIATKPICWFTRTRRLKGREATRARWVSSWPRI